MSYGRAYSDVFDNKSGSENIHKQKYYRFGYVASSRIRGKAYDKHPLIFLTDNVVPTAWR